MAKGKSSKKGKGSYATYKSENRAQKNKIAKLERHLKRHPNDEQVKKALANAKKGYNGRTEPSRKASRVVRLVGAGKGDKGFSLNRLGGKLSNWGKLYQQLKKVAQAATREAEYQR